MQWIVWFWRDISRTEHQLYSIRKKNGQLKPPTHVPCFTTSIAKSTQISMLTAWWHCLLRLEVRCQTANFKTYNQPENTKTQLACIGNGLSVCTVAMLLTCHTCSSCSIKYNKGLGWSKTRSSAVIPCNAKVVSLTSPLPLSRKSRAHNLADINKHHIQAYLVIDVNLNALVCLLVLLTTFPFQHLATVWVSYVLTLDDRVQRL